MGDRDAGGRRAADARADPGDDMKADAGRRERQSFLAATAENEGIAALQPHHAKAGARQFDQALVDAHLRRALAAGALAHGLQSRLERQGQDLGRDQRVMQNDVRLRQRLRGLQCQQVRIAWPRADQPDGAWPRPSRQPCVRLEQGVGQRRQITAVPAPRCPPGAQQVEAISPVGAVLRGQTGTDARSEAWTGAVGRNGQQQVAAADFGDAVEVAQGRAVLDVDQHAHRPRQGRQ